MLCIWRTFGHFENSKMSCEWPSVGPNLIRYCSDLAYGSFDDGTNIVNRISCSFAAYSAHRAIHNQLTTFTLQKIQVLHCVFHRPPKSWTFFFLDVFFGCSVRNAAALQVIYQIIGLMMVKDYGIFNGMYEHVSVICVWQATLAIHFRCTHIKRQFWFSISS